jgi:hypothetical protein
LGGAATSAAGAASTGGTGVTGSAEYNTQLRWPLNKSPKQILAQRFIMTLMRSTQRA